VKGIYLKKMDRTGRGGTRRRDRRNGLANAIAIIIDGRTEEEE